jgi:O-antigen biosynthesis protein
MRFIGSAPTILDVGCGRGQFSSVLAQRGCRVTGIETDTSAADQASMVCQNVLVGDVESPETQSKISMLFDIVLFGDVLEHLRNPDQVLLYAREKWLKPDGHIVVSVPNSGHWIFRREVALGRFPYRDSGLFDRTHLRFYNRSALIKLLKGCGYAIEQVAISSNSNSQSDCTFTLFSPFYRKPSFHLQLTLFENHLAHLFPTLFAYQFILKASPEIKAKLNET